MGDFLVIIHFFLAFLCDEASGVWAVIVAHTKSRSETTLRAYISKILKILISHFAESLYMLFVAGMAE
jgi:hypothetical protein